MLIMNVAKSPSSPKPKSHDVSLFRRFSSSSRLITFVIALPIIVLLFSALQSSRSLVVTSSNDPPIPALNHNIPVNGGNLTHSHSKNIQHNDANANGKNQTDYAQNERVQQQNNENEKDISISVPPIDFAIMGFPKTGTSTLLEALRQHPEVEMPS